ncbi:DUF6479 family protein [Streptacidiphilus monticola]|jgi:hypothetical protein|uniref:DUF6479 family protein n=1 Tax=Streptacidiphilus monticola TaxID=2161674 RepID=A0ABW1G9M2_9ACTN
MMTALQLLQLSADTTNRSNGSAGIIGLIIGIIVVAGLIWAFVWGKRRREKEPPPIAPPGEDADAYGDIPSDPRFRHETGPLRHRGNRH